MHELLTTAEMSVADRLAGAGGSGGTALMERAGRAVADLLQAQYPQARRIIIVAGPGNNGGDGFVTARLLAERGYVVRLQLLGDEAALKGDAREAADQWAGEIEAPEPTMLRQADVIVDALFGAGLGRPVEGMARTMISAMNEAGVPVVAVDLPSGVNGTSGAVMGLAVRAARTVTFFRRKPGHLLLPGRLHCGTVHLADIGIPATVLDEIRPAAFVNGPALWGDVFPLPRIEGHKYARGHVVAVSGGLASTGAARLAARGALRAGAGLVTIASPPDALLVNAAASLAVMVRSFSGAVGLGELLADRRRNAVVLGPGGGVGSDMRDLVLTALQGETNVVLDADALTSFADDPPLLFAAIRERRGATVLTPHEGEFGRLFSDVCSEPQGRSKLERARLAAQASGAVVLLKGPDTVIAAPDGRATIGDNGPPWLATAGSGDVLAGLVAGLLAQGMPAQRATAAAVWLHGEAAREVGPGLIAEDLPEVMPAVYRRLIDALGRQQ